MKIKPLENWGGGGYSFKNPKKKIKFGGDKHLNFNFKTQT